jgi:hypothetical protein
MCDYSLHAVNNRLAKEGESLFVHKFHTGSKGLASDADLQALTSIRPAPQGAGFFGRLRHLFKESRRLASPELRRELPAVCVLPGARLYVEGIPSDVRAVCGVGEAAEATFVQLTAEPFRYRDALRFANGAEVLVQKFPEGMEVEILSLALAEDPEEEPEEVEVEELAPAPAILVERRMSANA